MISRTDSNTFGSYFATFGVAELAYVTTSF